jgi:hypothetical protein
MHTDEVHNLYFSPNVSRINKSRKIRWMRHVVHREEMRNAYKILVEKSEGKRALGRPRRRWEDNTDIS